MANPKLHAGTPAIFVTIALMDLEPNIPKGAKDGQVHFLFGTLQKNKILIDIDFSVN